MGWSGYFPTTRIASGLFVSSIPFFGTRKIPSWKQGLALTTKLQKRLVFAVSEALFTTQTLLCKVVVWCNVLILVVKIQEFCPDCTCCVDF